MVVDLDDDVALPQAALVGIAVLADEAYHGASSVGDDGHLGLFVADGDDAAPVVGLEEDTPLEGVDDDGTVVEQFRANVGTAFLGDDMHVAERELVPLQTVEGEEEYGVGTFHAMSPDGMLTDGTSLNLCGYVTTLIDMLLEALAIHGIKMGVAGVEQHAVHVAHKGTDPHVGHEAAELVFHLVAQLLGKELLLVGKDKATVLHVYLTAEALVDEVEADNAVIASGDGTAGDDGTEIAVDGEMTHAERGQLHHAHGIGMVVDIEGNDVAHLTQTRRLAFLSVKGGGVEDGALRGSGVEEEAVLLALYLNGQQDAVVLKLNGDGVGTAPLHLPPRGGSALPSILIADGKAEAVAVHVLRNYVAK